MRPLKAGIATLLCTILAAIEPVLAAQLCPLVSPPSGTITVTAAPNSYYSGTATASAGGKTVGIGAQNGTTAIGVNDEILIVQMQDSAIDASDSSSYGSGAGTGTGVTSDNTSGLYEYAVVTAVAAGSLTIAGNGAGGGLINTYHSGGATGTQGQQTFQVVRVPRYNNVTLNIAGAAVQPWNGSSGGVFAIDASGTVTVTGTLLTDGAGFRGGGRLSQKGGAGGPDAPPYDYVVGAEVGYDGSKGEGTVGTPELTYNGTAVTDSGSDTMPGGSAAYGSPGNAGGGGTDAEGTANSENTGGGGGANGGNGGNGGNDWSPDEQGTAAENSGTPDPANSIYALGGLGGAAFAPRSAARVVLGGGGGAGTINNNTNPPNGASGGPGGGMILIRAGTLSGGTLSANGGAGVVTANDGGGGGGAGGTIVVTTTAGISGTAAIAMGGTGSNANPNSTSPDKKHGPGGGGGGGVVISSSAMTTNVAGGANGTTTTGGYSYGAAFGAAGVSLSTATPAQIPGVTSAAGCIVNSLTVAKSGTTQASPGGLIQYSIVVSNAGPGRADGTSVSDPVPAGLTIEGTPKCTPGTGSTCGTVTVAGQTVTSTIATLPVGGSVTFTIFALAPAAPANPYTNTVTIAPPAGNTDPNATTSSVVTTVSQTNGVSKTVRNVTSGEASGLTADIGKPGDTLEYTLSFTNNTSTALSNFAINDTTPANTTFVSATCGTPLPAAITACNLTSPAVGGTGTVIFTYVGTLNAGQTGTFLLDVKID